MKWNKLGLVYAPPKKGVYDQFYAMMPTPVLLPGTDIIRVYFGMTDANIYGRTFFVDVNANNPKKIIHISNTIVLDLGKPGTFDDSGAVPSSIISVSKEQYLYYVGFQRVQQVPYMLFSGLATSTNWENFTRYSESPIIERSKLNIYSNAAPFVLFDKEENLYKMWFWVGKEWIKNNEKPYIKAEIHYSDSSDGINWNYTGICCIAPNDTIS